MAVTITKTVYPEFCIGNMPGCVGGSGEDYRTVSKNNTVTDGFGGTWETGLSAACQIVSVTLNFEARIRTTSNTITSFAGELTNNLIAACDDKNFNGGSFYSTQKNHEVGSSNEWANMAEQTTLEYNEAGLNYQYYYGVRMKLHNPTLRDLRFYFRNVRFTITRTRACYITFKGDGITTKTVTQEYNTIPSFGSTPTREGYTFKGWSNGSTTYTGTLPMAYETDVTYTAVWELAKINKIYVGTVQPKAIYVGNQEVKGVYVGTTKIYG